ncbi:MAG: hypothetical protein Q3986_06450 [Akkermansia sp.]|nr:hypothetical protein [Akkermansia sp.]
MSTTPPLLLENKLAEIDPWRAAAIVMLATQPREIRLDTSWHFLSCACAETLHDKLIIHGCNMTSLQFFFDFVNLLDVRAHIREDIGVISFYDGHRTVSFSSPAVIQICNKINTGKIDIIF